MGVSGSNDKQGALAGEMMTPSQVTQATTVGSRTTPNGKTTHAKSKNGWQMNNSYSKYAHNQNPLAGHQTNPKGLL